MKHTLSLTGGLAAAMLATSTTLPAQSVATDPVGYTTVTCLPNSDTIVSVPFLNTTDSITSAVSGSATEDGTTATFTLNGITGLTTDQYATYYYVRFTGGTLDGNFYQITANGSDNVTIELNGDAATDISDTDTLKVYKFWTLGTLFPQATQDTIVESASNRLSARRTEVLIPDNSTEGVNRSAGSVHFLKSTGWADASDNGDSDNKLLWPDSYIIIRHPVAVSTSTTYTASGTVDTNSQIVIPLSTRTTGAQDNYVAVPRPVDVALNNLNLYESGAFVASTSSRLSGRRDELHIFDNTAGSLNKSASKIFYHDGTNWIDSSDKSTADTDTIKASEGIIIRKYQTLDGATHFWNNTPSY
ncbi:TIGR02597 family protein [Rubritalea marina]|uniref:TIGR02597 family protein n=1 Tax=Rubritalea marina TaxID=361055 RepID=UPI0014613D11|nr:TIGR02597 family protein [Rubritalea marina]